jgi:D-xylose transport system substrate-binding protein
MKQARREEHVKHVSRKVVAVGLVVALVGLAVAVAVATAGTAHKKANIQVCVLLPETKTSVRWVQFDAPLFKQAFAKAHISASVTNALGDAQKQKAQADACLAAGAKVVIETAIDAGSAAAIEKSFTSKGGKAIDYDRQVAGGTASVYITFDGVKVGRAQANIVLLGLKASGKYGKKPVVAELWGGQTDANAGWFKSGNDEILNPLFQKGTLTKGPQQFVDGWLAQNAATDFQQFLVKTNNKIDGVVAANDNIAGAVVATLKAKKLPPIALSGQDATAQGVQNIISGWQTGTVYKKVPDEVAGAAKAAIALLKGQKPASTTTRPNGNKSEPTVALPVTLITKANYKQLFRDRFLKRSEVCVGQYKKYCK